MGMIDIVLIFQPVDFYLWPPNFAFGPDFTKIISPPSAFQRHGAAAWSL